MKTGPAGGGTGKFSSSGTRDYASENTGVHRGLEEGGSVEERQNNGDGGMEVKTWRAPSGILLEVQGSRGCFDRAGSERVYIGTLVLLECNREVGRGRKKKKKTALQTPLLA